MARAPSKDKNIKAQVPTTPSEDQSNEDFSIGTAKISSKKIN